MGDRGGTGPARLFVLLAIAVCGWSLRGGATATGTPDVGTLMAQVGERVAGYYRRAESLVCLETHTVQPIHTNWAVDGMARTVVSELRIEAGATMRRELRRINGRQPRERDKRDRSGCTDPTTLADEPLAFLVEPQRDAYMFTAVREGRERDRAALVIDYLSLNRQTRAELIKDERGHEDCFDWSGPIAHRGRVWVDAASFDVLRVDRRNDGPVDVSVPWKLQRSYLFDQWVTIDRDDSSLRFKAVTFTDPAETLVLPESVEAVTVVRSGLQSTRRTTTFSDHRRFLTAGRVRTDR